MQKNAIEKVFFFVVRRVRYPRRNESGLPPLNYVLHREILRLLKESMSQGLKPVLGWSFNVRTKVRTYLRDKNNSNSKNNCNCDERV